VILTVLLIAGNSTAMTVRERTGEVAVMRALGFERPLIASLLFGECAVIGVLGGAIGAAPALWMFRSGVTLGPVLQGNGALWVTPVSATQALVVAIAITVVSALPPVVAALRIAPALAFRKVV
jgi:putative ABC transport system permease protein